MRNQLTTLDRAGLAATPRIRLLPAELVAQIAAGEVIERPASVVKELMENAIDAGARRIDVDLEAGGVELIRVVDDGCGINPDDLPLAFTSHATSKLHDAEDLFRIATMGFRGEALASIGGVAQVTLQSRPAGASHGAEVTCEGHRLSPVRPWNGRPGTRIEVRHLFYNVPARRKFLKSPGTELGHVCEILTRLALAYPNLHLTLKHNGKLVYDIPASAGLLDRVGLFFGRNLRDALYPIESPPGEIHLSGYIADPHCDRGNPRYQYFFVNRRIFRDRSLAHAFQDAYRGLLMTGRYPVGFLFLSMPHDQVDVNVHPAKAEVRFQNPAQIYSLVRSTVMARLRQQNLIPTANLAGSTSTPQTNVTDLPADSPSALRAFNGDMPSEKPTQSTATWEDIFPHKPRSVTPPLPFNAAHDGRFTSDSQRGSPNPTADGNDTAPPSRPESANDLATPLDPQEPSPSLVNSQQGDDVDRLPLPMPSVLQVHDSYLIAETPEGVLVIDQHALHERILFEQLCSRLTRGRLEVQRLLVPEPIELPVPHAATVLEFADDLRELGWEVSEFGGGTILLSSYPTLLGRRPPHEIFLAVVDELIKHDRPPTREAMLHRLLATMACKAAVKAGDRLTTEEMTYLLNLRQLAENSHHCPHGRPTSLLFSRQELDKQFRRLG